MFAQEPIEDSESDTEFDTESDMDTEPMTWSDDEDSEVTP